MSGCITTEGIHEDDVTTVNERIEKRFKYKPFSTKKDVKEEFNLSSERLNAGLKRVFGTDSVKEIRKQVLKDVIDNGADPNEIWASVDVGRGTYVNYIKDIVGEIPKGEDAEHVIREYQEGLKESRKRESEDEGTTPDTEYAVRVVGALYAQGEMETAKKFLEGWVD